MGKIMKYVLLVMALVVSGCGAIEVDLSQDVVRSYAQLTLQCDKLDNSHVSGYHMSIDTEEDMTCSS